MTLKPFTLEEVWQISDECLLKEDRYALGELAEAIAEDGNLYTEVDLDRIIRKIECEYQKLN